MAAVSLEKMTSHLDDAAEAIMSASPEPQEHAINQRQESAANVARDSAGTAFDSSIHTGTQKKDGTWRQKHSRGTASKVGGIEQPAAAVLPVTDPGIEKAKAAGAGTAQMLIMMCVTLGGDDWKPRVEPIDENAFLQSAFGEYFAAKKLSDIPPGLMLTFALLAYAGPRFTMPATRQRVGGVFIWGRTWLAKRRIQKRFKTAGINGAEVEVVDGKITVNGVHIPDLQP